MKIKCFLSQSDAIKAGINEYGDIEIDVDVSTLSSEQRVVLAGSANCNVTGNTVEALINALNSRIAQIAEDKARDVRRESERNAEIDKIMQMDDDTFFRSVGNSYGQVYDRYRRNDTDSRYASIKAKIDAGNTLKREAAQDKAMLLDDEAFIEKVEYRGAISDYYDRADIRKRHGDIKTRLEQEESARQERRKQQLADYLQTHMTELQKKKFAEGLMDEEQIISAIRDEAFAPLNDIPIYEKLTAQDIYDTLDDEYGDESPVEFDTEDAETISDEQFELIESVRQKLQGQDIVEIKIRLHRGGLKRHNEYDITRLGLMVKLRVGEITVTREFAI